jgi:predicted SAM-dependent methyltransferase
MRYLNVGCGFNYSNEKIWTNLDFNKTGNDVIPHNLLQGIPFENESFNAVYHSHVLEHFSKSDGLKLLKECYRVLKPGGVLRIAVPDLEQIARSYIQLLDEGLKNPIDTLVRENYNWILLEMYDQTVRNFSGGEMGNYLLQKELVNESFVYQRIGEEGRNFRNNYLNQNSEYNNNKRTVKQLIKEIIYSIKRGVIRKKKESKFEEIGRFRLGGEIHQWMYDRYSLTNILQEIGFEQILILDAFSSHLKDWTNFELDGIDNIVRKPDSLFIEGIKK